jgi:hypothetical protein
MDTPLDIHALRQSLQDKRKLFNATAILPNEERTGVSFGASLLKHRKSQQHSKLLEGKSLNKT